MIILKEIFEYLGLLILLINVLLYSRSYRNIKSVAFKIFSFYLITSFLILITSIILWKLKMNNLYLSHFYFIIQFLILSFFYKQLFNIIQNKIVNTIIISVSIILTIQYISNPDLLYKFNVFEVFITSFPLIVYSIIHLYNSLTKKGEFMYINAGVLIYLSISTLIFILGDYISVYKSDSPISEIWLINKVLYIVYLLLILIEWKKSIKQAKSK